MAQTTEEKASQVIRLIRDISRDNEDTTSLLAIGEILAGVMDAQDRKQDLGTLGVKCVLRLSTMT